MCVQGLVNSARTAGPIVTDEAPFDSPIRRNEDGADFGSISSKWHVARAAPSRLANVKVCMFQHKSHPETPSPESNGDGDDGAMIMKMPLHASYVRHP